MWEFQAVAMSKEYKLTEIASVAATQMEEIPVTWLISYRAEANHLQPCSIFPKPRDKQQFHYSARYLGIHNMKRNTFCARTDGDLIRRLPIRACDETGDQRPEFPSP
jgi:hypothetical protein